MVGVGSGRSASVEVVVEECQRSRADSLDDLIVIICANQEV